MVGAMMRDPKQRPRNFRRFVRFAPIVLVSLLILAGISIFAVSSLGIFLPVRQALADQVLATVLNRPVQVRGNVELKFGERLGVSIEDAYVKRSSGTGEQTARAFEVVRFDAGYDLLWGEISGIRNFQMRGAEIVYSAATSKGAGSGTSLFKLPSLIINSPILQNLELADVVFQYQNTNDGWNETLDIKTLELSTAQGEYTTSIAFDSVLNGTPLKASGKVTRSQDHEASRQSRYELEFNFPGFTSRTSGTIDTTTKIATVDGKFASVSESLKELLSSLGLVSVLDGRSTLDWNYSGSIDQLRVFDLRAFFANETGDHLEVTGQIDDGTNHPVVDLAFKAMLALPETSEKSLFAIRVKEISGNIAGPFEELSIDRAQVLTTAAVLDFDEIGPISVGRVVKHADNRVGLEDIVVQNGPKDAPHLLLKGRMEDLIGLRGVELAGSYHFPTDLIFDRKASSKPELGFLKGNISLNEDAGRLGIAELSGFSSDTSLFNLTYDLSVPELRIVDELAFSTNLTIPEPALLLNALDVAEDQSLPAIGFTGSSNLSPDGLKLSGTLSAGATKIQADIKLAQGASAGSRHLGGSITSDRMDFSDLAGLVDFAKLGSGNHRDEHKVSEEFKNSLTAKVDLAVKQLVTGKKKAGNLSATVEFAEDLLQLSKLKVDYIGGTIRGDFGLNTSADPKIATAKGRMEKFPLKSLMKELGLRSPISSTVYSSFDIRGSAKSETAFLKSLSGSVTTSLWGGVLPGRLLELSGLSAFTWMMTANKDNTTKLVCAVLPLRFKNGTATTKSLIVETENVQIVGAGSVSFRTGALNLSFVPRAKRKQLVEIVSPFELHGTISAPDLEMKQAGPGRAVGEVASLPFNLLGHIFQGSGAKDEKARPCVLPKNSKPK
jgi:AsmA family protein